MKIMNNLITLEDSLDSGKILDETDVSSCRLYCIRWITNSDSKNESDSLILNEKIDFLTNGNVEINQQSERIKVLLSDIATGSLLMLEYNKLPNNAYNTIDSLIIEDLIRVQDSTTINNSLTKYK